MKVRILVALLLISFPLNAAGIVFFILFLNEHGHYKSVKKEKAVLQRSLVVAQSGSVLNQSPSSDSVQRRNFVSLADGLSDGYAFQAPQYKEGSLDYTLLVYLHGMGSNQLEPFVTPAGITTAAAISAYNSKLGILSPSYRKEASWGNDAALGDIVQNIREVMQEYPFKKIVLMGTSMGGCVSLNFAATAPEDIKSKIVGVVCVEGAGDLTDLYNKTKADALRPAMMIAFGGAPDQVGHVYHKKSFLSNLDSLPKSSRIYVLSAKQDRVVPPELQKAIVDELNKRGIANHLDEVDIPHEAPPADYYCRGIKFVLGEQI